MAQTTPSIQGEMLTYQQNGQSAQVTVDTAGWYSWLETASTFTFRGEQGSFTAYKERAGNKRGGMYWRAYRKRHGKLHRAYLGKSLELTLERLRKVAAVLAGQGPAEDAAPTLRAAPLQVLEEPQNSQQSSLPALTPLSKHPYEPEHRRSSRRDLPTGTITLLFTDIEGSTRLLQQLGDRYESVLADCRHLLRHAFLAHHGQEVDTQGDSFFVAFARATDAVSAAVGAQRALASHPWPEGAAVRVRMGLHTGEPSLTHGDFVGLDVHHAARIMSAGNGGQILLSQTTQDLVEYDLPDDVSLRDLGDHRLKDLGRPIRLFQAVISELPADFPPLKTLDTHPHNLPVQPTPLVGREREVATVCELLRRQEARLVTLTGPGGIGKTRLGVQVAAELSELFVDGMFFVDLAPLSDPALVVPTIAQRLSIWEGTGQSLLERLKEGLHQKQALLLLDNFEQVLSAAVQVADLLTACPRLKVLVTSRERLHVRAEQEFSVPPLALPATKLLPDLAALAQYEAVTLFLQCARAVKADFQLTTANARAVTDICAGLDGLPLAIELAAARLKLLPPQALQARFAKRLPMLTSGAQDAPARQQTLQNTIAWSYHLLSAQERCLFRRLAVFAGGCTLEAVEAVYEALGDETGKVFDGVASLIDKSLVQQRAQKEEEPRLVMLETIREYGLECLESAEETETTRQSHAAYYLALAEEAAPELQGPQQAAWLERLELEHDNLRAALEWFIERGGPGSNREMALRLGGALAEFWIVRGLFSEGRAFLERVLAGSEGAAVPMRAKALSTAANLAFMQSNDDWAEALCQESLVLYRDLGDTRGIAFSLSRLAWVAMRRGDFAAARTQIEESLALNREVGDKDAIAWSLFFLADNPSLQGEYTRGRTLLEESLAMFRELGNKRGIATSLKQSALWLFVAQGDQALVRARLEESLTLFRELGDKDGMAYYYWISGWVALSQGDTVTAHILVEQSLALWQEMGSKWYTAWSLGMLGKIAAHRGDLATARALLEEGLAILRASSDNWFIAFCLEELASVVTAQGEPVWAARLWGAAEALRDTVGLPLPPVFRADYERSVAAARAQLGDKAFTTAWAEGRTMTPEQVFTARGPVTVSTSTPPAKSPTIYPDGLTLRQVEVLRLVAQGMTNEQVAEQLVISPRTVNTHLTSIFGKIGVSSRSAATRYAIERHLI
jgi:predicted ATPase/class 3 adenylate cyclase/DNA-binding CsgD family transcriptional regulator